MTFKTLSLVTATLLLTTNTFAEEQLRDITVVTANKTVQSIQNITSNVTVITAEDIEENGYQTISQAISRTSGIIISQNGGLGQLTSVFTRGMNGGQTLILLDGMRLNDPSTPNGAALLETFSTANVEQIEIIKGGESSIWGSNASAGVINIITKNSKNGLHGSTKIGYGTYNTKNADIQLTYKNDNFNAQVQASKLKTDGISALAPRSAEADGYENKNYNIKLGYTFDKNNKVLLNYNYIKTDTQFDGFSADDVDVAGDSKQKNYSLKYIFTLDNFITTFLASKSDIKRRYASLSSSAVYASLNEADLKEYSVISQYNYDKNKIILGLEYKNIDGLFSSEYLSTFNPIYNSTDLRDTGYKNKAIFLSNVYNISNNTLLETNLRYDDFNKFNNKTTYKIGLKHTHNLIKGFITRANYYTSYDAPSIYQLAKQSPSISSLKPMYTKGFDVSASYKDLLSVTYFKNKVTNDFINVGIFPDAAYINTDKEETFSGIEIESNYAFTELGLNLSANYTRLLKFEDDQKNELIRRPKEVLNVSLDHYTDNHTHIGINAQYIGDRKDSDFNSFPASEVSTGNYTLWNLNFGTNIMEDVDVSIHAKNIFDKDYQSVYGYATEGRSFYANLKYSF